MKLGGRLEEYVYGIPTDQRMVIDNLSTYFRNLKFDVVIKENQTPEDLRKVISDFQAYYKAADNLFLHRVSFDGTETALGPVSW